MFAVVAMIVEVICTKAEAQSDFEIAGICDSYFIPSKYLSQNCGTPEI